MSNILSLLLDLGAAKARVEAAVKACTSSRAWQDWALSGPTSGEAARLEMDHFWAVHEAGRLVHDIAMLAVKDPSIRGQVVEAGLFKIYAEADGRRWLNSEVFPVPQTWVLPPEIDFAELPAKEAASLSAVFDEEAPREVEVGVRSARVVSSSEVEVYKDGKRVRCTRVVFRG